MSKVTAMLRRHEGFKRYAYQDHLGNTTIGVGRCVQQDIGLGLTDDEIDYLLDNDIKRCRIELQATFRWYDDLNEARQDALINLCFNVGLTRLRGFKRALDAMERRDYHEATEEFMDSKWASQVGTRALEVTEMIRTGAYGS